MTCFVTFDCKSFVRSCRCSCPISGKPLCDASSTLYLLPIRCCSSFGMWFIDVNEFPTRTIVGWVGMHFCFNHNRLEHADDWCTSSINVIMSLIDLCILFVRVVLVRLRVRICIRQSVGSRLGLFRLCHRICLCVYRRGHRILFEYV